MRHEGAVLAITSILSSHVQSARDQRCECGWRGDVSKSVIDPNNIHQQHRRHVAEMILDAGILASAWESGHQTCRLDPDSIEFNPYRPTP